MKAREAEKLLAHGDLIALGQAADAERAKRFGDRVTFIVDRNINYTNVCQSAPFIRTRTSRGHTSSAMMRF